MEFEFDVNLVLPDEISKINNKLQINDKSSILNDTDKKRFLITVIDRMGWASAKAQDLHVPVTSGEKLMKSDHSLYVMKERKENNDGSVVVGILKIGKKKLFVLDRNGVQYEMLPSCVLDFYVHESRQRIGCGKTLFEYMLKDENVDVTSLAIDRPSRKFLAFLRKHYKLNQIIPQVNNFVVFQEFFKDKQLPRRKSLDLNQSKDSFGSKGVSQPIDARCRKQNRASFPLYSETKTFSWHDDTTQENRDDSKPSAGNWQPQSTLGLLQWPDSSQSPPKLSPDKSSCGSHGEDSTMKIFGVPSSWMQTSGQ